MAMQELNTSVPMLEQRTKINANFALAQLTGNKTDTVTSAASTTKYTTEKAVYDYTQKLYYGTSAPVTKNGDLFLFETSSGKGKIKYNVSGTLKEMVPDRAIADSKTKAALTALNAKLPVGEIVVESDTGNMKIGDGNTLWTLLPYHSGIKYGKSGNQSYIKFANGMIQQWGSVGVTTTPSGTLEVLLTMPIPFTEAALGGYATGYLQVSEEWDATYKNVSGRCFSASQYRFVHPGPLSANAMYDLRYFIIGF